MIPRNELMFTLAMAEKGLRSETPPEVMAELCRVYLAWVDAPEVVVSCALGPRKGSEIGSTEDDPGTLEAFGCVDPKGLVTGQRVRIVEVPDVSE